MDEYRYMNNRIELLLNAIELLKNEKYVQCTQLLQDVYNELQEESPKNIPEVYFKNDRIGYSRWINKELNKVGTIIQEILVHLDKKEYIESNCVVAFIEGAVKMVLLSGVEVKENIEAIITLYRIINIYNT